jgi:hypothetical protein
VAVVTRRHEGYFIAHVEGATPTLVNGGPITATPHPLKDRDTFELADVRMEFRLQDAEFVAPEPAVESRSRADWNRDRRLRDLPDARLIAHCLLTNQDLLAEPFPRGDWPCDPRPFYPEGEWHVECLRKATSVAQLTRCIRRGFDLYFNLCDGAADQDTPGIEVVRTLERHCVPFTGATSEFYEPSRVAMKHACGPRASPPPTTCWPATRRMSSGPRRANLPALREALQQLFQRRYFPSLARRDAGGCAARRKIMRRHGRALSEFIEGTEVTVLVAENPTIRHDPRPIRRFSTVFPKARPSSIRR